MKKPIVTRHIDREKDTQISADRGIKFALEQATKAQRGVEAQLYSFFNLGTR
jgi:hypothetical protein